MAVSMKQQKQQYAMKRVWDHARLLEDKLIEKYTKKAKGLTDSQKLAAIKNNEAKLLPNYKLKKDMNLLKAFSYHDVEPKDVFDEEGFRKDKLKLHAKRDKVRDEIMLGDEQTALKLIKEFCK